MKLCFPVTKNEGLESTVYDHFGSAPSFVVVDTADGAVREIFNRDLHHAHGACQPLRALGGEVVQAVVVGGIGAGALRGLQAGGIKVYRADGRTVAENVAKAQAGALPELGLHQVCGGHGHGGGCGHHA